MFQQVFCGEIYYLVEREVRLLSAGAVGGIVKRQLQPIKDDLEYIKKQVDAIRDRIEGLTARIEKIEKALEKVKVV